MKIALLIISIVLIIIVLLQSSKADNGPQIISGGQSELFANRKERGSELVITRITMLAVRTSVAIRIRNEMSFFRKMTERFSVSVTRSQTTCA